MNPFPSTGVPDRSDLLWIREPPPYFRYPSLSRYPQLVHGAFTRQGGTSSPPYDFLNTSYDVGDLPRNVTSNLAIIKNTLGANHLMFMNQSHGNGIFVLGPDQIDRRIDRKIEIILDKNSLIFKNKGFIQSVKKVLSKFYRENKSEGGFGLGLFIVKKICDEYNFGFKIYNQNGYVIGLISL